MRSGEKWLYMENSISQQLILFWLVGNTAFTLLTINSMDVTVRLGFFVMLNIALSLMAFLIAVRQRAYYSVWAYVGFALGIFQLARLFWIPTEIINPIRLILQILLITTSVAALVASYICIQRSQERQQFIEQNNVDFAAVEE